MTGKLIIVGLGPGDPDLVTLKAVKALQKADLIAYPVANGDDSFARRIAAPHIPEGKEEYAYSVPMRVERGPGQAAYDEAAAHLEAELKAGKDVALLCEGDPFFYGSAMYIFERLQSSVTCEIIPGVTSITACAARAQHPLVARNEKLKILPAPLEDAILKAELENTEAAAIMKVGRHFERIRALLRNIGADREAIVVEAASLEEEKVTPLNDIPDGKKPYFSTILVYRGNEKWGAK